MKYVLVLTIAAGGLAVAQDRQQSFDAARQGALLKSLIEVSQGDELGGKYQQQLEGIAKGQLLTPSRELDIQREVEGRLKPVPIQNGALTPRLTQPEFAMYRALVPAEEKQLLDRARSVARIEVETAAGVVARGTGFVVGGGLLATNCHVLAAIAARGADGRWNLHSNATRAHFADGPEHTPAQEFKISGVAGYPEKRGLDVALLRVETKSVDGSSMLPGPLVVRATPLSQTWKPDTGLPVAVVGYPVLVSSREVNFQELSAQGRFAKVYSPGAVMELQSQDQVDLLLHVAGTTVGSSGSPVFAIDTFDVIGVHNCCTAAGAPPPAELACSQIPRGPARRNLAIAAPNLFADPQIAPFFKAPAGE